MVCPVTEATQAAHTGAPQGRKGGAGLCRRGTGLATTLESANGEMPSPAEGDQMVMSNGRPMLRVAAVGAVHCSAGASGALQPTLEQMARSADVLTLCGDLTNHGLPEEAHALARELTAVVKLPVLAVLGNHDFESNKVDEVRQILHGEAGVVFLDGDCHEIQGVGFAGCKGFGGGFGRGTLSAFGEPGIKRFVQEAIEEAMKLESALIRVQDSHHRIAILHYSPI